MTPHLHARALAGAVLVSAPAAGAERSGTPEKTFRAIYFGNSCLENSVPWFHPTLAKSAGVKTNGRAHLGPGWQIWMHVNAFHTHPGRAKKSLVERDWDAVVIQHFGTHPVLANNIRRKISHNQEPFPEPRDVSDLASASAIIDLFLARPPDRGRAFLYSSWPGVTGAAALRRRLREEARKSLEAEGLPRYTLAATCFATMFRRQPRSPGPVDPRRPGELHQREHPQAGHGRLRPPARPRRAAGGHRLSPPDRQRDDLAGRHKAPAYRRRQGRQMTDPRRQNRDYR